MLPSFLSAPSLPSVGPPGQGLGLAAVGWPSPWLRWRAGLLALLLLAQSFAPWAWDTQRMQQAAQRLGPRAVSGAQALQALVGQLGGQDEEARLALVNQFFNRRVLFKEDSEAWGQIDYWASPLEMLNKGEGDCEDYAIAKYFALLAGGVAASKLRLVYVRAQMAGPGGPQQAHMVLAYYPEPQAEPMILDNLISEVRPASRRPDLTPVFSFNAEGLWQGTGPVSAGDPAARLSRWRDVLQKAKAEGF